MLRPLCLAVVALALALPASALAQNNPFGPLPQAQPTAPPTATASPSASDQGDTSRTTVVLIGGALVVLFAVIGTVIVRDARRKLPRAERGARPLEGSPHRRQRQAKAKARAKGRAARQARKRTTRNR